MGRHNRIPPVRDWVVYWYAGPAKVGRALVKAPTKRLARMNIPARLRFKFHGYRMTVSVWKGK